MPERIGKQLEATDKEEGNKKIADCLLFVEQLLKSGAETYTFSIEKGTDKPSGALHGDTTLFRSPMRCAFERDPSPAALDRSSSITSWTDFVVSRCLRVYEARLEMLRNRLTTEKATINDLIYGKLSFDMGLMPYGY